MEKDTTVLYSNKLLMSLLINQQFLAESTEESFLSQCACDSRVITPCLKDSSFTEIWKFQQVFLRKHPWGSMDRSCIQRALIFISAIGFLVLNLFRNGTKACISVEIVVQHIRTSSDPLIPFWCCCLTREVVQSWKIKAETTEYFIV